MSERDQKRAEFEASGKKKNPLKWVLLLLPVVGIALGAFLALGERTSSAAYPVVKASGGQVVIAENEVGDGKAHFFTYRAGDVPVNFFVLRSQDGVIRAALDTCDVCYRERKGYRQEGDTMVCNNCDMKFVSNKINVIKGGCNPAPITRSVEGGQVRIAEADLRAGARFFAPVAGR